MRTLFLWLIALVTLLRAVTLWRQARSRHGWLALARLNTERKFYESRQALDSLR